MPISRNRDSLRGALDIDSNLARFNRLNQQNPIEIDSDTESIPNITAAQALEKHLQNQVNLPISPRTQAIEQTYINEAVEERSHAAPDENGSPGLPANSSLEASGNRNEPIQSI